MINRLYGYRNVTIIKTFILARYSFKDFRSCWAASSALRLGNQWIVKLFKKILFLLGRQSSKLTWEAMVGLRI